MPRYRVENLPPAYSEADEKERLATLRHIRRMNDEHRERLQPLFDRLASIDARYGPRMMLVPDEDGPIEFDEAAAHYLFDTHAVTFKER